VIWVPRIPLATDPLAVRVVLAGHLLGLRQHALDLALQRHHDDAAGVGARVALDDAGDDLAFLGGELAEGALVLGVAQALHDDLPGRGGGDAPEALRRVVPLVGDLAVRGHLLGHHAHQTGLAVDVDAGVRLVAVGVAVGGEQGGLDRLQHGVEGDLLVALDGAQRSDVDVHAGSSAVVSASSATSVSGAGLNSTSTAARSTSA
jgi:hypothetical protein